MQEASSVLQGGWTVQGIPGPLNFCDNRVGEEGLELGKTR